MLGRHASGAPSVCAKKLLLPQPIISYYKQATENPLTLVVLFPKLCARFCLKDQQRELYFGWDFENFVHLKM